MLIRLVNHHIDNPAHIDKLISIKGLPDEWFYRNSRFGGRELIKPWEPDVEVSVPKEIRHLCEPVEITQVFPPVEKGREYVVDKKIISSLRFDYMTEAGQTMWDQIERYLERTVPRDQMVPKPVLVAPDHKSGFNPQETRRTVRGSLEMRSVDSIPTIDVRPKQQETETISTAQTISVPAPQPEKIEVVDKSPEPESFKCGQCDKTFEKKQALTMHVMRGHAKKEPVGA